MRRPPRKVWEIAASVYLLFIPQAMATVKMDVVVDSVPASRLRVTHLSR